MEDRKTGPWSEAALGKAPPPWANGVIKGLVFTILGVIAWEIANIVERHHVIDPFAAHSLLLASYIMIIAGVTFLVMGVIALILHDLRS